MGNSGKVSVPTVRSGLKGMVWWDVRVPFNDAKARTFDLPEDIKEKTSVWC